VVERVRTGITTSGTPHLGNYAGAIPPHDDIVQQWSARAGEEATRAAHELFTRERPFGM
jgi:hypothetical protein